MNILSCKNLSIGYCNGDSPLHANISFDIQKGSYVLVRGDNGTGKSTLIKTLLGIISPLDGEINKTIETIGYLPQQRIIPYSFPSTVNEVVLSGLQRKKKLFYSKNDKIKTDVILKKIGIYELKDKRFSELSGGQQQKVLLCRALNVSDEFLILDEPDTGLDIESTKSLYKLIKEINDNGTTIMMISHDNDEISGITHILNVEKDNIILTEV